MPDILTTEPLREAYEEQVRRLQKTIDARERWLSILSAVAVRTHGLEDEHEILDIALAEILGRFGLKAGWVFLGSQATRTLEFAASRGVSKSYLETVAREGLDDCLCPEVFWTGHRMEARNTTQCPRMPTIVDGLAEPVAHACIPLRFEGQSRGVLNVAARPGERFGDDDLRFLETLGHQICVAVERSKHLQAERQLLAEAQQALGDLQATQAQLVENQKMAVLGTFASSLAHEIRNPLNSIGLQLSILERRVKRLESEAVSAELHELSAVIRSEISRLDALVGDFLLFSRTHRSRHLSTSLETLVDEVVQLLSPEAEQAGVTLVRRRSEPLPDFAMDPEKMKQVAINLVRNGIEAVGRGGLVSVETGILDDRARLVVSDDGKGLPPGIDVFQLFVTTKAQGTGLGLSIAQQIVAEHGGEIAAGAAPGGGARFTVLLPIAAAEARAES